MPRNHGSADKKVRILQALDACLQIKPFDQTSIKDIARMAGINPGLLHYHFKSKDDILVHYIDYVLQLYRSMFHDWMAARKEETPDVESFLTDYFQFMNEKIAVNKTLSAVFIEIWEIALYSAGVREKLKHTYREWIDELSDMLTSFNHDATVSRRIGMATVAFLEGMALFSVILEEDPVEFQAVLGGFQKTIVSAWETVASQK